MREQKLQKKCINYAKLNGFKAIKTIRLSESGHADVFLFKDGKTIFVEFKKEKVGIKSEIQLYRQKEFRKLGFVWEFIDNFNDFKKILI